jgi:hypothetical protein
VFAMKYCWMFIMLLATQGAMAASNCDGPQVLQELQNAPAQEMQAYRAGAKPNNCSVSASELMARPKKAKASGPGGSASKKPSTTAPSTGAYVPKTKDDNTPYRFDMNQNGKRMTAEEFDAWMKAKGISVATGKPGGPSTAQPVVTPAAEPECKPTKRKKCK